MMKLATKTAILRQEMYITLVIIFLKITYSYTVSMHSKPMISYLLQSHKVKL